jgi:hypothetical protein
MNSSSMRPFHLFVCIGIILSILFSSGQIENPDTHLRLTQTRILIEEFKIGLPFDIGEDTHGNIAINKAGQRYMVYNLGQSLLCIPIYLLAKLTTSSDGECYYKAAFMVSFINFFIHALCAYLLFTIARSLGASTRKSYFVAFMFCFTSYSFCFAQSTYEHHFEMLFVLLGYYFVIQKNTNKNIILSGMAISIGLLFRSTLILAIPGILLLITSSKQRIYFAICLLPGIASIIFYNYFRFGHLFDTGYNQAWQLSHGDNESFWAINRIPISLLGFLLSPGKGLLIFSPTIVLGLAGIKMFWNKHKKITQSIMVLCAFYITSYSMNFAWHGSIWSLGPRYILPIVPFLYLPAIEICIKKWMYVLLFVTFLGQILITSVNYKRELLEQFILYKGIDQNKYIYGFMNIPYIFQYKQLMIIAPKNISAKLENHFPSTPWKKEIRTVSGNKVLELSIEKNSINYWWIRQLHLGATTVEKIAILFTLLLTASGTILIGRHVKKNI